MDYKAFATANARAEFATAPVTHCGYVGCQYAAVAQMRQLVGKGQVLPICQTHKDELLKAWANRPASIAHLPVAQVMEPLVDRYYTVIGMHADGSGESQIFRRATSLSEALARAERDDAGIGEFSTFGVVPEDYEQARAEGIAFNEADGLLVDGE